MIRAMRVAAAALGFLLGAQAIGKLLDVHLYIVALDRFHTFPPRSVPAVAGAWILVELCALLGLGLAATGLVRARPFGLVGAGAALGDALAYAALTIGASARGIDVLNCTCFGAFLPQRLGPFVLAQDVAMVACTSWMLWAMVRAARPHARSGLVQS